MAAQKVDRRNQGDIPERRWYLGRTHRPTRVTRGRPGCYSSQCPPRPHQKKNRLIPFVIDSCIKNKNFSKEWMLDNTQENISEKRK